MTSEELREVIEQAAQADHKKITGGGFRNNPALASVRNVAQARNIIKRFLDGCPEWISVLELRELMDGEHE